MPFEVAFKRPYPLNRLQMISVGTAKNPSLSELPRLFTDAFQTILEILLATGLGHEYASRNLNRTLYEAGSSESIGRIQEEGRIPPNFEFYATPYSYVQGIIVFH